MNILPNAQGGGSIISFFWQIQKNKDSLAIIITLFGGFFSFFTYFLGDLLYFLGDFRWEK